MPKVDINSLSLDLASQSSSTQHPRWLLPVDGNRHGMQSVIISACAILVHTLSMPFFFVSSDAFLSLLLL